MAGSELRAGGEYRLKRRDVDPGRDLDEFNIEHVQSGIGETRLVCRIIALSFISG